MAKFSTTPEQTLVLADVLTAGLFVLAGGTTYNGRVASTEDLNAINELAKIIESNVGILDIYVDAIDDNVKPPLPPRVQYVGFGYSTSTKESVESISATLEWTKTQADRNHYASITDARDESIPVGTEIWVDRFMRINAFFLGGTYFILTES
jgi:hypothetical protein